MMAFFGLRDFFELGVVIPRAATSSNLAKKIRMNRKKKLECYVGKMSGKKLTWNIIFPYLGLASLSAGVC